MRELIKLCGDNDKYAFSLAVSEGDPAAGIFDVKLNTNMAPALLAAVLIKATQQDRYCAALFRSLVQLLEQISDND